MLMLMLMMVMAMAYKHNKLSTEKREVYTIIYDDESIGDMKILSMRIKNEKSWGLLTLLPAFIIQQHSLTLPPLHNNKNDVYMVQHKHYKTIWKHSTASYS